MNEDIKENITSQNTWIRGLYMLLFALIYSIAEIVFTAVAIFQFLVALVTGKPNELLLDFGQSLSTYIYQIIRFFTFNSDEKPYPFAAWPQGGPESEKKTAAKKKTVPAKRKTAVKKTTRKVAAKSLKKESPESDLKNGEA